jgi:hypothetical protein
MKTDLVQKLIEKGAIKQRTEIEAYYKGIDLSGARLARVRGNFIVLGARLVEGRISFDGLSTIDGTRERFLADDILMVDGMDPERFAHNFGLDINGETLRQGKRRGRKPKILLAQMAAEKAALAEAKEESQLQKAA